MYLQTTLLKKYEKSEKLENVVLVRLKNSKNQIKLLNEKYNQTLNLLGKTKCKLKYNVMLNCQLTSYLCKILPHIREKY